MFLDGENTVYQGPVTEKGAYLTALPVEPLNHWIHCFWQLKIDKGEFVYRSIPDNCVDWIFDVSGLEASFLVSPFSSPVEFYLHGPVSYFGIRFKTFGYQGLIDIPVGEWQNRENTIDAVNLVDTLVLEKISEAIYQASSFDRRCQHVSTVFLAELKPMTIDYRLEKFVRLVRQARLTGFDSLKINSIEFGVSARQLRRLSHLYLGLSLKNYMKVARFQTILHWLNVNDHQGFWANHYYDQSHFIREFKSLSGVTPEAFQAMSVLYNKDFSGHLY